MSSIKKILLAGNWKYDIYEEALSRGFLAAGADVFRFNIDNHISCDAGSLRGRLRLASDLKPMNAELLKMVKSIQPDLVFAWRFIDLLPETIREIRRICPRTRVVIYHNDNPYESFRERLKCRHFLASHRLVDVVAVYRPGNVNAARSAGAGRVEILPASYIRDLHVKVNTAKSLDVTFIGHFEPDGRADYINALHRAGFLVNLFGSQWDKCPKRYFWAHAHAVQTPWGKDYVDTINRSKICLAFLSKKNADVYTRRSFEIPACGTLMLSERTPELQSMFKEGVEADFFSSPEELVRKVEFYLANDSLRETVAEAGMRRLQRDGHDEYARAKNVLGWFE